MRLLQYYKGQGYVVYMDNYYSGTELYSDLYHDKVSCIGTVKSNRKGLPKEAVTFPAFKPDLLLSVPIQLVRGPGPNYSAFGD